MTAIDRQTPSLDELWTMLKDQQATARAQQAIIQAQQTEIEELKASLQGQEHTNPRKGGRRETTSRQPRDGRLSRAGLLKGAVAGLSGVAAAELAGTIGASPAAAADFTQTNFLAIGGTHVGFSNSSGYDFGCALWGAFNGVSATCTGKNTGPGVPRAAVRAGTDSTSDGYGVIASSINNIGIAGRTDAVNHSGIWGYNTANGGWGVWGATYDMDPISPASNLGNGVGVRGESGGGTGVHGTSVSSYGGHFSGGLAPLLLDPASTAGPPSSGSHQRGEVMVDASGTIYHCVVAGNPGTWVPLISLVPFSSPHRVFSSPMTAGQTSGPIDVTVAGVPAGARSAWCAVQSSGAGVLTLYPDGATDPGIANWSGVGTNALNLLYMQVPLSAAGQFRIHAYFTGQVYVDVWGYLF